MTIEEAEEQGIRILDEVPEGWKCCSGATAAPLGYAWYWNQKSRWSGEYEHALVKEAGRDE